MKIALQIEVQTDDHSSPLFEDVEKALREQIPNVRIRWADYSLDRWLDAKITVDEVRQG